MTHPTAKTAGLLVLVSGVFFSLGPILYRGVDEATAWQYLFYRSLAVTVVTAMQVWLRNRGNVRTVVRAVDARQLVAGMILSAMFISFIVSLTTTDAASTLLMQSLAPYTAALAGWILLRERVDRQTWVAMIVAVIGVVVMIGQGRSGADLRGLATAAIIPLGLGVYTAVVRADDDQDPVVPAVIGGLLTILISTIVAGSQTGLGLPIREAGLGLTAGSLALGVGLPIYNRAREFVPAARATLLIQSEVVLGPLWVWIWPGERPAVTTLIGGAIILGALVWLLTRPPAITTAAQPA